MTITGIFLWASGLMCVVCYFLGRADGKDVERQKSLKDTQLLNDKLREL